MAHDGQGLATVASPVMAKLTTQTAQALTTVEALLPGAVRVVRDTVSIAGKVSSELMEENQTAAHALAWLATCVQSLRQMQGWATRLENDGRFGETEQLILQIAFGEYLSQIPSGIPDSQGEIIRLQDLGLDATMLATALKAIPRRPRGRHPEQGAVHQGGGEASPRSGMPRTSPHQLQRKPQQLARTRARRPQQQAS